MFARALVDAPVYPLGPPCRRFCTWPPQPHKPASAYAVRSACVARHRALLMLCSCRLSHALSCSHALLFRALSRLSGGFLRGGIQCKLHLATALGFKGSGSTKERARRGRAGLLVPHRASACGCAEDALTRSRRVARNCSSTPVRNNVISCNPRSG